MNIQNLKTLLKQDSTDQLLTLLLQHANKNNTTDLHNTLLLLSADLERAKKIGRVHGNEHHYMKEKARINKILSEIIDEINPHVNILESSMSINKKDFEEQALRINQIFEDFISIVENEELKREKNSNRAKILESLMNTYERSKGHIFQIAVMALVKSGKSTFINALLGQEFLPVSNVPETALPIRIAHDIDKLNGTLENNGDVIAEGAHNITAILKKLNQEKRDENLKALYNLTLRAPVKALAGSAMDKIKFEILDTPGFGEADIESINKANNRKFEKSNIAILEDIGAIIYLLDYTKLKTTEEYEVLDKLSQLRSDLLETVQERLFFVVNKIDMENRNGLTPEQTVDYVWQLVYNKVPKIKKEQIFTTSANDALLARLIIDNKATQEAVIDFKKQAFGRSYERRTDEDLKKEAEFMLLDSNLSAIEKNIINFIYENRGRLLFSDLLSNIERSLNDFKNKVIETAIGTLNSDRSKIEDLQNKIEEAKKKSVKIEEKSTEFETNLKLWIDKQFNKFRRAILNEIEFVFDDDILDDRKSSGLLGFIKKNITDYFDKEQKKAAAQKKVSQLNIDIFKYLQMKFKEFKLTLESQIVQKQNTLYKQLQDIINELSAEFENVLEKSLNIQLSPVDLVLEEIDENKILVEVSDKIDRFIRLNEKQVAVKKKVKHYEEGSWCEDSYTWEEEVWDTQTQTEYEISKEKIQLFWTNNIENLNKNAQNITSRFVDSYIRSQIINAKRLFNDYVNDYTATIKDEERNINRGGNEYIEERLQELYNIRAHLNKLLEKVAQESALMS